MKRKTQMSLRKTVLGGLVSLLGATGLSGMSGCSEFNKVYEPNPISSTHKIRGLYSLGQKVEGLLETGKPHIFEPETDTLYVRAENFDETLTEFGLRNTGTYNEFFETNRIEVKYTDPRSGKQIIEKQIVPNDGTIDVEGLGSFDAFTTRQGLDEIITKTAREKFGEEVDVTVKQITNPMQDQPNVFLGYAIATSPAGLNILGLTTQPISMQGITFAGPMADTKYMVGIKRITNIDSQTNGLFVDSNNDKKIIDSPQHPDYIRRVVVMGETGKFAGGVYPKIKAGDEDVYIGLGNRPLDNLQGTFAEVGETTEQFGRITGGFMDIYGDAHSIGHEWTYLPGRGLNKPAKPNRLQRMNGYITDVNNVIDGINGLNGRFNPSAAPAPATE